VEADSRRHGRRHGDWALPHAARGNGLPQAPAARFKYLHPDAPSVEKYTLGAEWPAFALGAFLGLPIAPIYREIR
jgi:hypothetical protein